MKFTKLTKKLLLSALSLGLAVVTLTTTTFAWYTASTEASASGAQGTTSGTTADSTLQISSNGDAEKPQWAKTATITVKGEDLVPLVWQGGKTFKDASNQGSTSYYAFSLWFRTTKTYDTEDDSKNADIAVYLKNLKITNAAQSNLTRYDNLLAEANDKGSLDESTYAIDVVRALDMVISNDIVDTQVGYNLSNQFNYAKDAEGTSYEYGFTEGEANAETYYDGVMGSGSFAAMPKNNSLTDVSIVKTETNLGDITVVSEDTAQYVSVGSIAKDDTNKDYDILKVTFYIYLNGEDKYCFDACKGQTFNISLEFTTVAKTTEGN